jgi:two-component system cell cycle sensor histidine kinase/response regulator CckA
MQRTDQSYLLHDVTNLLTVMSVLAESLRHHVSDDHQGSASLSQLERTIDRAKAIALRVVMDRTSADNRATDVNEFIDQMAPTLVQIVGPRIDLVIRTDGPAGKVSAGPDQIERILLNLVLNASAATPAGGRITVETAVSDYVRDAGLDGKAPPRHYLRLTVRDNGSGIPPDLQPFIFEPFFTTRPVAAGLGLNSVQRTVLQLKGRLYVESEDGIGTSVHVDLPVHQTWNSIG